MDTRLDEFVKIGLERYPEAQRTIEFFRDAVLDILDTAISATERPSAFMRSEQPNETRNVSANWITRFTSGRVAEATEARIEVGVWWNASAIKGSPMPIVYANLLDALEAIQRFELTTTGQDSRVRRYPQSGKYTRLYVAASTPPDLAEDVRLVLSVLQDEIERVATMKGALDSTGQASTGTGPDHG